MTAQFTTQPYPVMTEDRLRIASPRRSRRRHGHVAPIGREIAPNGDADSVIDPRR
jgi:hypothetical protein